MKQSDMIEAAQETYEGNIRGESLRILSPGDEVLREILDKFLEIRTSSFPAAIACFYETLSSNVGAVTRTNDRQVSIA